MAEASSHWILVPSAWVVDAPFAVSLLLALGFAAAATYLHWSASRGRRR